MPRLHLLLEQGVEIAACGLVAKVLVAIQHRPILPVNSKTNVAAGKNNSELSKSPASETSLTLRIEQPHSVNTHTLTITLNTHAHTH